MTFRRFFPTIAVLFMTLLTSGCGNDTPTMGSDLTYLTSPLQGGDSLKPSDRILPLTPGNVWEITSYCVGKKSNDRLIVIGPTTVDGVTGMMIHHLREGKLWRREIYRETETELQLLAAQDETSGLMQFEPPLPILKYPANDGDYTSWTGRFVMDKVNFPAYGYSRLSGREKIKTPAGIFSAIRIDTILFVTQPGGPIRFPAIRWLSPGIGFVRRGFADQGKPSYAEVTKFNVR